MTLEAIVATVLSPIFILSMILSGVGYGMLFLWSLNAHDDVRLYLLTVVPGLAFLGLMFALRGVTAGILSPVYLILIIDWMVFSHAAYVAVHTRRWLVRRRVLGSRKPR